MSFFSFRRARGFLSHMEEPLWLVDHLGVGLYCRWWCLYHFRSADLWMAEKGVLRGSLLFLFSLPFSLTSLLCSTPLLFSSVLSLPFPSFPLSSLLTFLLFFCCFSSLLFLSLLLLLLPFLLLLLFPASLLFSSLLLLFSFFFFFYKRPFLFFPGGNCAKVEQSGALFRRPLVAALQLCEASCPCK